MNLQYLKRLTLPFFTLLTCYVNSYASEFLVEDLNRDQNKQKTWVVLPYAFSSQSMGFTAGAVGIWDGYIQPQMSVVATLFMGQELAVDYEGNNESEMERASGGMFAINSYRPSFSDRLFINAIGAYGYYPNQRLYLDGSNDSEKDLDNNTNPFQSQGYNNWYKINQRYILPIGESKHNVLPTIQLQRGIAVNRDEIGGGKPFVTGQTIVGSELFYSKWSAEKLLEAPELNTNGVRLYIEHNNTDYPSNPSRGYSFKGQISADFGLANSTQSWNTLEAEYSHYFELDNFSWSRQNLISFNLWSAYSPSWDQSETLNGGILDKNQPPMWEGAHLGGWTRMRAYDSNRFSDKAALYGAIEYRLIPRINPLADLAWNPIPIDWFQLVLFAEAGRVAEEYDPSLLLSDMKYDVGFSLRALAAKVPVRFEMAFGEEGTAMWVMIQQPF